MQKKLISLLVAVIVMGLYLPMCVFAAPNDDITMEAEVGFDGHFKLTQWTPVSVYIENRGQDIKGDIEIVGDQDSSTAMLFTAPAVIPKGSKKRIDLYVRMNTLQKQMNIDLKSNGKVLKTIEVDQLIPMSTANFMMGVLTEDQSGLSYWWEKQSGDRLFSKYEPIALEVYDIPDRREPMDNFSMLIIDDFDTSQLTSTQKESLSAWVDRGGILLIGTGGSGIKTLKGLSSDVVSIEDGGISKEVKPKVLQDLAETEILTDVPVELMDLSYDSSWKVVAGENTSPYILMKRQGNGYIFVSSFSIGKQPITGWSGSKILWERVFEKYLDSDAVIMLKEPQMYRDISSSESNYSIFEALANISEMDPPSADKLIIILMIYLIIIGPLNYFLLKKIDRRELAWFTIPVLVILFSLGIYSLGSKVKGNEVVANVISTVELSEDSPSKNIDTYTGVFIPKRGDYSFSMEGDGFLVPGVNRDDSYNGLDRGGKKEITAQIIQGANPTAKVFDINMWTMETFFTETYRDDLGSLDGDLLYRDGKIIGSIENNTNFPLEDVVIMTNIGYHRVGNLAGGAKKDINFKVTEYDGQNPYSDVIKFSMIDDVYPPTDKGAYFTKRRLVQDMVPIPSSSYDKDDGNIKLEAVVFGFNNQKLADEIYVDGKLPKKSYHTNLVIDKLYIQTGVDGKVAILPGMVIAEIDERKSSQVEMHEMDGVSPIYLYGSKNVSFYFDMNGLDNVDIDDLTIYLKTEEGKWHGEIPATIRIYDRETDNFVDVGEGLTIDRNNGTIDIDPALLERYIDGDGRLYINVGIEEDVERDYAILRPTIGIEGRQR